MSENWTILRVLDWTAERFGREGLDSPRLEAQVLLSHVLDCDRVSLYTRFDQPLAAEELAAYRGLISRRLAGEPTAYLVGEQEFWSLPFYVDADVLIPRPDSETVIELVLDQVDRSASLRIADIGTGSGALGVTLAHELPSAQVVAVDVSQAALAVAGRNASRNGVEARVELRHGSLLQPLAGDEPYDVIVANLPYVEAKDIDELSAEVRSEPRGALDGGDDGLRLIAEMVSGVSACLAPQGLLALEHGHDQGPAVRALIDATGSFSSAQTRQDLAKRPRVTHALRL